MTLEAIRRVIQGMEHIVGDNVEEQEQLVNAIYAAQLMDPHAVFLRDVFSGCTSDGRVIKAAANGKFLGAALDAAWKLAVGK